MATLALLRLYAQDLKLTKLSILTSPHMPQFPHSEWTSVLTGVMVNLDHVLLGMHAVSNNNREVELIRGIQLKYGAAEVAKKGQKLRRLVTGVSSLHESSHLHLPPQEGRT